MARTSPAEFASYTMDVIEKEPEILVRTADQDRTLSTVENVQEEELIPAGELWA
jgi:hypothetical protein